MKVLLVGNPNTGKTTLFNCLTNSKEKTANWTGVTVLAKAKKINADKREIEIVDLPGLYSLNAVGEDELAAKNEIE